MLLQTIILALCVLAVGFLGFIFYRLLELMEVKQEIYKKLHDFSELEDTIKEFRSILTLHIEQVNTSLEMIDKKREDAFNFINLRLNELNKKFTNKY